MYRQAFRDMHIRDLDILTMAIQGIGSRRRASRCTSEFPAITGGLHFTMPDSLGLGSKIITVNHEDQIIAHAALYDLSFVDSSQAKVILFLRDVFSLLRGPAARKT